MMTTIKNDNCGLINSKIWHLLYKDAISSNDSLESFQVIHVKKIIEDIFLLDSTQHVRQVYLCCGHESRFSDTLILLKLLSEKNYQCVVYLHESLVGFWRDQYKAYSNLCNTFLPVLDDQTILIDLIRPVDVKKLNSAQSMMIQSMNESKAIRISLDYPSGLNPDTGGVCGQEICKADYTLSLFGFLQGLWTGLGKTYSGEKRSLSNDIVHQGKYTSWLMHSQQILELWPHRLEYVHKGCFKKVKFISGQTNMFGATLLAAKAALLMGAGLVEVYHPQNIQIPYAECPELIWHPVGCPTQIPMDEESIWVAGPGLGMDTWALSVWKEISRRDCEMVVDASALRWLSKFNIKDKPWVITPHPGEAAELLSITAAEVQNNRFRAIEQLQHKTQMTVVLKGSGTLVMGTNKDIEICPLGHAGMATPGMGDVLTGMIAGLYAQVRDPVKASILGVWLHAAAGDRIRPIVTASHLLHELQFHLQDVLCT